MRFAVVFLTVLLLTQLVILGINIYEDEEGRMWRGYPRERWMAAKMLEGYDIAGRQDFRIRALVTETIGQRLAAPEIVVLGSSRALLVGEKMLRESSVSNNAISSARLVHYFSVLGQYAQRGMTPKVVLIGADPWIFKEERFVIWPMEEGVRTLAPQLRIDPKRMGMNDALHWTGYFSGLKAWKGLTSPDSVENECGLDQLRFDDASPCAVRRHDGSLKYPEDQITLSPESIAAEVLRSARGRMHSYDGYRELDAERIQAFRQFLIYLQSKGIRIAIFLAPYHPLVEEHQQGRRDWKLTQDAEASIRGIAQPLNIPVLGAYSAAKAQCAASEFYDGIHAKESCIQRILSPFIDHGARAETGSVR
ncbi:MAG: hypothetical protein Q7U76_18110 [Nitrospirota bacterium]|nr:hypothetical protein [Nitrospirota bacterium]